MNNFNKYIKRFCIAFFAVVIVISLSGCVATGDVSSYPPLDKFTDETNPLGWLFIYPFGWIMNFIGNLFGGSYGMAIIFTTIIVRVLGWPIYVGQSQISANMQLAQPDIDKLNAKYLGRDDQASQMAKGQEMREIYQKHNISFKSCLAMPIQFCLFSGMTQAMKRVAVAGGALSFSESAMTFLGFDLRGSLLNSDYGLSTQIFTGVLIVILVCVHLLQTFLSRKASERQRAKSNRPQTVNPQMDKTMKLMTYGMPIMFAFYASGSTAYALYWVIGNICSLITSIIVQKRNEKKFDAAKNNENTVEIL